jgi:hypothetical protein
MTDNAEITNYFNTNRCCNHSNWEAKKNNFKARFPVLTDSDLVYDQNEPQIMLKKLETTLHMNGDELYITILTL